MEPPRVGTIRPGEVYAYPVVLRKVGKIKIIYRWTPAETPVGKDITSVPTGKTLTMRKSQLRRSTMVVGAIWDKISKREVRPVDNNQVISVVQEIVREQSIDPSSYLILDYALEMPALRRPYLNLWLFTQDTPVIFHDGTLTIRQLNERVGHTFYTPRFIIPKVIRGNIHENLQLHNFTSQELPPSYAQVYGPTIWFADREGSPEYIRAAPPAAPALRANVRAQRMATTPYNGMPNVGTLNIPRGSTNVISLDDIEEGDEMVNFHGEHGYGRYYKKASFNGIPITYPSRFKKNPTTRANITQRNVRKYKAHLVGGKKRKTRKQ